jgi:heme/copper-type cytochrome/quinol oxidase subunit 2
MTQPPVPPAAPQYPAAAQPAASYPGKVLGIVGLIVAIFFNVIGLIISIIAFVQSKRAGFKNTPALVGIIIGIITTIGAIIFTILMVTVFSTLIGACAELGSGTHYVDGVTYTCS